MCLQRVMGVLVGPCAQVILLCMPSNVRTSEDPVEAIGIARALTNVGDADVVLEMRAAGMEARSPALSLDVDEAKKIIVVNKSNGLIITSGVIYL